MLTFWNYFTTLTTIKKSFHVTIELIEQQQKNAQIWS